MYQNGGGIETSGGIDAIHLMLLQSNEGFLRLFPCWFPDKDAGFKQLRARGAFLVSSELRDGRVRYIEIESEKGKECRILNPWEGIGVEAFEISGELKKPIRFRESDAVVAFDTRAGATYRLQPAR